ncbi:MAG: hypothetical protein RMJ36_05115 [Candidatus Calescibacterium sp.]|nr:hypothetical protein [Candidatus Calescibacterium sp.]MDW8133015.1 hypothetical protein [Candidatus Calescibacterium sp.]
MKRISWGLKIFIFSFISYFSAILIIFVINEFQNINRLIKDDNKKLSNYSYINYYSILDLYDSKVSGITKFINNYVFASFRNQNKLYLLKIDLYGNIINSFGTKDIKFKSISLDEKKMYARLIADSQESIYSILLDYNLNKIACQKIVFDKYYKNDLVYLDIQKVGFLLENEKKYLVFCSFEHTGIRKNLELLSNQSLLKVGFDNNFVIFNLSTENKNLPLLIDVSNFEQYIINQNSYVDSFSSNDGYIFLILRKENNSQFLLKISKKNRKIVSCFEIQSGILLNFEVYVLNNYLILYFDYNKELYLIFINDNGMIDKVRKVNGIYAEHSLFANPLGLFLVFYYQGFPFMIRFDNQIESSHVSYFSISEDSDVSIVLKKSNVFSMERLDFLTKSNNVQVYLEKTDLEFEKEDVFLKAYSTF